MAELINKSGIRDDKEKPRLDLIPPTAILEVAKTLTYGVRKYQDSYNYLRGGMSANQFISACYRHLNKFQQSEDVDLESGHLHLAHACANLLMLLEGMAKNKIVDDRYRNSPVVEDLPPQPFNEAFQQNDEAFQENR